MTENERIAKFMGLTSCTDPGHVDNKCYWFEDMKGYLKHDEMKYNISWDWLMPVVEKIEARERTLINIYGDGTKIWVDDKDGNELFATTQHGNKDHKIGHVYRAVVEFIKWFETREERRNETSV